MKFSPPYTRVLPEFSFTSFTALQGAEYQLVRCEGGHEFSFTVSFTSFTTAVKGNRSPLFDCMTIVSGVKVKCFGEGRRGFGEGETFTHNVLIISRLHER